MTDIRNVTHQSAVMDSFAELRRVKEEHEEQLNAATEACQAAVNAALSDHVPMTAIASWAQRDRRTIGRMCSS